MGNQWDLEEEYLIYATKSVLCTEGKHAAADLLTHATQFSLEQCT